MATTSERRMMIDGQLVESFSGRTFTNVNPATEDPIGQVADASDAEMDVAIGAARRAFDETAWSTDRGFRKHCLQQLHDALLTEREQFRVELVSEVGAPIRLTYGAQLDKPLAEAIAWPLKYIDEFAWERYLGIAEVFGQKTTQQVVKEPTGVVGAIVPWNFPVEVTLNKVGQALATGNTVVLKPAPDTPYNATRLGRLVAQQTDVPPGVFNVVTSSDPLVGERLVRDHRVDLISFTGSTATGKRIMEMGAATLKRLFLELGGKSANILLDDADFETVLPEAATMCSHAGQGCAITTRMLVPRSRYGVAVEMVRASFERVQYGDPFDPANIMGPVISSRQQARVLDYVELGKKEGARLVTGGGRPAHLTRGYFVEPTLFADVDNGMRIAQEEIFGPVLVMIPFEDDDDAVRIANDSQYGLGGAVSSGDLDRARKVASRIRTGTVRVNGGNWYGPASPFGGYKCSGIGRQNGLEGFEQYLETKTYGLPA